MDNNSIDSDYLHKEVALLEYIPSEIGKKQTIENGKYYCQDGHKRISAIYDMIDEDVYHKRRKINIVVMNNGNSRSNDCWRVKNMH